MINRTRLDIDIGRRRSSTYDHTVATGVHNRVVGHGECRVGAKTIRAEYLHGVAATGDGVVAHRGGRELACQSNSVDVARSSRVRERVAIDRRHTARSFVLHQQQIRLGGRIERIEEQVVFDGRGQAAYRDGVAGIRIAVGGARRNHRIAQNRRVGGGAETGAAPGG